MNKIPRPPVGADDAMEHTTPAHCRGRFIVPTADLSASLDILKSALNSYCALSCPPPLYRPSLLFHSPDYFVNDHNAGVGPAQFPYITSSSISKTLRSNFLPILPKIASTLKAHQFPKHHRANYSLFSPNYRASTGQLS